MSYAAAGRWVSERLSSATASENEHSPNTSYTAKSTSKLPMPRSYERNDEEFDDDVPYLPQHRHQHHPVEYHSGNLKLRILKILKLISIHFLNREGFEENGRKCWRHPRICQ